MSKLRERLEAQAFPDLGAMMEGYARGAAGLAKSQYRQELDFSAESINALDEILVLVGEDPEIDLDYESRLVGQLSGRSASAPVRRKLGDDAISRWRGGGSGNRCSRLPIVSADEGLPTADDGRRRGPWQLLQHGYGAAGQSGAGELRLVFCSELVWFPQNLPSFHNSD